ncbi:AsnC family transcriptional regulator [Thiohalobacter sp. IOR34]|uniref:siroheme decarboxylase subunit beta n=1 Tax=Thiohalobacter sp. IOR34 TaxID=3057176 RepID=UPI0025AF0EBD|nr:AsnC family transcriptional regulator [Thiohalobacter sp. IOR34]WJW75437.1 AsnC family transcriptional regulator [Thiohalobacter sp. IOR34]
MNRAAEQIPPQATPAPLDDIDRAIVVATQAGLPRTPRPYHEIAERLGLEAEEVMRRLQAMLERGIIRRIGAVPNHYRLGFRGNGMSVWDVPDRQVREIGERIGALDFVSHCYHRPRQLPDWPYNLFAMVHGRDRIEVRNKVLRIAEMIGDACRQHDVLFSTRILKKTGLRIG